MTTTGGIAPQDRRERALAALQEASAEAVGYFHQVDASLFDGYQNAHEVLAHLLFWQCEHITVAHALLAGQEPPLQSGTLAALNRRACRELKGLTMQQMTDQFAVQAEELDALLRRLPDWGIPFPIKQGGLKCTVEDRVFALATHIDKHVATLRRAAVRASDTY